MASLTLQQLCAEMSVSESTVRRWVADGLPFTPVGTKSKRYDLAEVKAWLRGRGCQSGSTKTVVDMSDLCAAADAFTASSRKAHLRVMPRILKQT